MGLLIGGRARVRKPYHAEVNHFEGAMHGRKEQKRAGALECCRNNKRGNAMKGGGWECAEGEGRALHEGGIEGIMK